MTSRVNVEYAYSSNPCPGDGNRSSYRLHRMLMFHSPMLASWSVGEDDVVYSSAAAVVVTTAVAAPTPLRYEASTKHTHTLGLIP